MKAISFALFNKEIPAIDEKFRPLITFIVFTFAIGFSLTVPVVAIFEQLTTGPGLVDTGISAFKLAAQSILAIAENQHISGELFASLLLGLLGFTVIFNAVVTFRGYTRYPEVFGYAYPIKEFLTFFLANAVSTGLISLALLAIGVLYVFFGADFDSGWEIIYRMTVYSQGVVDSIPIVIELPYPLPLVFSILMVDLVSYWFHRWSHSNRFLWLLFHRMHHISTHLIMPATQAVYVAVPLFILFAIPMQIIMGVAAKIFYPETMIFEAILLRMLFSVIGIYSHNSAYYDFFRRNRVLMFFGHMSGSGVYHYTHHSAKKEHSLINLGSGWFMCWDRLFGTFVEPPLEKPPVGLTNQPPLYMNPLRLGLSGMFQLGYEFIHNKDWKTRMRVVFGSSDYTPPISRNYAVKE